MPRKRLRSAKPKHDAAYKSFFTNRRTVTDTLRGFARNVARRLDFSTLERLPASFVTEHLGQRHADMLWRIQTTEGGWLYLLILLEFQSTIDRRMAIRMMDYAARVWMGLGKDQLGPGGEYPFVLPIVIYNGEQRWNAATDIRNLLAPVPDELLGHLPSHRYLLIDIQALDPSRLPSNNVLAMIARFEQAPTVEELELLAAPLADWLGRIGEQELVDTFGAWITLVLTQRFGSTGRELELKLRNEEDQKMTTLIERARKWGEERDQRWLQRGRVEGERELVHRLAIRRFGSGITAQLLPLLSELREPEPIATVADAIIECQTADEFLARVREVGGLGTG